MVTFRRRRNTRRRPTRTRRRPTTRRYPRRTYNARPRTRRTARPVVTRNKFIKLPWTYTDRKEFTSNSLLPIKYAFSGNCLPGLMGVDITEPNPVFTHAPAGLDQYSSFYRTARVHGSSIRIEIIGNAGFDQASNVNSQAMKICLLALPYAGDGPHPSNGPGAARYGGLSNNYQDPSRLAFHSTNEYEDSVLEEMWNAPYERLVNHPYAKWFTLGGNGSSARCTLSMARSTKKMCCVKDLKDNDEFEFPITPFSKTNPSPSDYNIQSAKEGFVYFLYIFPTKAATTQDSIVLTAKLNYTYELFDMVPPQNQLFGVPI